METPDADPRLRESRVLIGRPGVICGSDEFATSNVVISDQYSYEGNWLFCMFSQPEVVAARIGFGRGKMDWRDYGLDSAPISDEALFSRIEVITPEGIYAYLFSDPASGRAVDSKGSSLNVRLNDGKAGLIRLTGWPVTHWHFRNPQGTLEADLKVQMKDLVVWPDFVMPRNTFGMCVGTCAIAGSIRVENRTVNVSGAGIYDHPRIVVQPNPVVPFGWYLYAPIRFADGTLVASYYSENDLGQKDSIYSAGFLSLPDGSRHWLQSCQARRLKVGQDRLPLSWETGLKGANVSLEYRVEIVQVPLARGWGGADPQVSTRKYVAYPLLMTVEGECRIGSRTIPLSKGCGIAEFLVRTGYNPSYP